MERADHPKKIGSGNKEREAIWQAGVAVVRTMGADSQASVEPLSELALGRLESSPKELGSQVKGPVTNKLEERGFPRNRTTEDREERPIDFRLLGAMLRASSDPDLGVGAFAIGVRVWPCVKISGG